MLDLSAVSVGAIGLVTGACVGFTARRARLCTLGAIESAVVGGDWRRLKIFGLALAIALLGTQALILAGLFDETRTTYLPTQIAWLSILLGATMFGLGMALVGTCAFGCLVRLGGGDLRSLVTLIVFSAVALTALRGALSGVRLDWLEQIAWPMPNAAPGSLIDLASRFAGFDMRALAALAIGGGLLTIAALDKRLRHSPRLWLAGLVLGAGVVLGWAATGVLVDAFSPQRPQSLTFVAPVARGLHALILGTGGWLEFSVMSAPGVALGSALAAWSNAEFRWEAFDDHQEMRRHLTGAVLMGLGGVLAGGCTIGQGLSAGSLLAMSWPLALVSMIGGAWLGLVLLVEGSLREGLWARLGEWRASNKTFVE